MRFTKLITAAVAVAAPSVALAVGPGIYSSTPVSVTGPLGLSGILDLPKYTGVDPLAAIILTLNANVTSDVQFESLDSGPITININVAGTGSLSRPLPLMGDLVVTTPLSVPSFNVSGFDGVIDFGGTSGGTLTNLSASDSDISNIALLDFPIFIGAGNVSLPYSLSGATFVSGGASIVSIINSSGTLSATIEYVPVPEPTSLGILAVGSLLLGRRRQA